MVPPHFCHQKKRQVEKSITYQTKRPCVTSLQMLAQNYYPIDSEGEVEYLNL